MTVNNKLRELMRSKIAWTVTALGLAAVVALLLWGLDFWNWLREGGDPSETNGTTLRNVGLIAAAIVALALAAWRSSVSNRQADISQEQLNTTQQSLRQERQQRAAEMLGSDLLATRLGGIYALKRLAEEYPEEYHLQVMDLLCAFVRNPLGLQEPKDQNIIGWESVYIDFLISSQSHPFREDIKAIMDFIGNRDPLTRYLELKLDYRPDLRSANLTLANLTRGDYSGIDFTGALFLHATCHSSNFSRAIFRGANFYRATCLNTTMRSAVFDHTTMDYSTVSGSDFSNARIEETTWVDADLSRAVLHRTEFLDPIFAGARFQEADLTATSFMTHLNSSLTLTQAQLDQANANPDHPPVLPPDAVDPNTQAKLVWQNNLPQRRP